MQSLATEDLEKVKTLFALFHLSTTADTNRAEDYRKSIQWILQLSKRLQSVEILNRDFRKVLKNYNTEDVFVYVDCLYLGTEDYYKNGMLKSGTEYRMSVVESAGENI